MDLLIGGQKGLGQSNSNLIRSRVVMFADLPGFKVNFTCDRILCVWPRTSLADSLAGTRSTRTL